MARPALVPWSLFALATAGACLLTMENLDLARRLGQAEIDARASAAELGRLQADGESLRAANQRLEEETRAALRQAAGATDLVEDRIAAEQAAREEQLRQQRLRNAPMPEGVLICLRAMTELLRADGFQGLRFVSARSLENAELREIELLDTEPDALVTTLYAAARMTATLDRTRSALVLRLFDGHRMCNGERRELPAEGQPFLFRPVDGPAWEARLPYLVRAEGAYPEPATKVPAKDRVDPDTRLAWQDRLNLLLENAKTTNRLRVKGFSGMRDGSFLEGALAGYDQKGRLCLQAMVASFCIEVDDKTGTAQLCLKDGTMIGPGGESRLGDDGYRILLPGLTPRQASDRMLGIVVRR